MSRADRNARSNLVVRTIRGRNGWSQDPHSVDAGSEWDIRFPGVPFVRDSRPETGNTTAGRGTTALDLFRHVLVETGDFQYPRHDFLSVKTDRIDDDGTLPSKVELSTGKTETLQGLLDGISSGSPLHTLIFASGEDEDGNPSASGYCLFLDLGKVIREHGVQGIEEYPEGGYRKGKAPVAYFKWSSARKCGGGTGGDRSEIPFSQRQEHFSSSDEPLIDSWGRKWVSADKVCYPELVISLSSLGFKRNSWIPIHVSQLVDWLENQSWEELVG